MDHLDRPWKPWQKRLDRAWTVPGLFLDRSGATLNFFSLEALQIAFQVEKPGKTSSVAFCFSGFSPTPR
jgi:hypothetical protein